MGLVLQVLCKELLAVGVVVLGRSLRGERRLNAFRVGQFQRAIHLVGGYMVEAFALILFRQRFPIEFGSLQQRERAHHIGASKGEGVFDATIHMALGSKVDDAIHLLVLHQAIDSVKIAYIGFEVRQVARVGQFIYIDNPILGVLIDEQSHDMTAYKTRSAGDDDVHW